MVRWVAAGKRVAAWARARAIPVRDALECLEQQDFKRRADTVRRGLMDRVLAMLMRKCARAVSRFAKLHGGLNDTI